MCVLSLLVRHDVCMYMGFERKMLFVIVLCIRVGCYVLVRLFFFFKQKTAYEMRSSDLSSDVCSSDLKIVAEMGAKFPVSWEMVLILDSSIRWYFFFAVWAALYVALGYANEMRTVEQRANAYRLEAKNAQLRALHYQVNPHFLFNTLNSLSTLVMRGAKADAEAMIMNLSAFLRSTLTIDPEQSVGLDEEIALQRLYLDIEQARFPDRLQVDVDIPQNLENACVPVLILQPIIENAIKYGVAPSKGKIGIRLSASHEYGLLVLRVENDVGPAASAPQPGTGFGLNNEIGRAHV